MHHVCARVKTSKPCERSIMPDTARVCIFAMLVSRAAGVLFHCCCNCIKSKLVTKLSASSLICEFCGVTIDEFVEVCKMFEKVGKLCCQFDVT